MKRTIIATVIVVTYKYFAGHEHIITYGHRFYAGYVHIII